MCAITAPLRGGGELKCRFESTIHPTTVSEFNDGDVTVFGYIVNGYRISRVGGEAEHTALMVIKEEVLFAIHTIYV